MKSVLERTGVGNGKFVVPVPCLHYGDGSGYRSKAGNGEGSPREIFAGFRFITLHCEEPSLSATIINTVARMQVHTEPGVK